MSNPKELLTSRHFDGVSFISTLRLIYAVFACVFPGESLEGFLLTVAAFEATKCQRADAKLCGRLCRCIPPDGKHAYSVTTSQLWMQEFVWAFMGVLRIVTQLLSFSIMFSFCLVPSLLIRASL